MSRYGYGPYDSATALRDIEDGEIIGTAAETPVAIDFGAMGDFKAVVNVTDIEASTDTEWTIAVQVDTSSAFNTPVTLWSEDDVQTEGVREAPLSGRFILQEEPGATHIRVVATQTGSGGAITYGAYLAPAH